MPKPFPPSSDLFTDPAQAREPGRDLPWRERRDWFRARLQKQPLAGIGADEIEVHFAAMPAHYWERVSKNDLNWGLETVHGFLKTLTLPNTAATAPFVNWRQVPESICIRVMLCTWDRHGLLAKAAAAFSAVHLNIVEAEVFTRADNVVLDLFRVSEGSVRGTVSPTRMQEMTFLLEGALSEPPRFASIWACSRHKFLAPPARLPPRITFDNSSDEDSTMVRVEASDRLGLLYDILQAMADSGFNIMDARISTENNVAQDVIYVRDSQGQKIIDSRRQEEFRRRFEAALNVRD